jgi:phosphoribosylformylglycinamidine (FGAM) synthase-like amidotransferase family enzyme
MTIFISGSKVLGELSSEMINTLNYIIENNHPVIIGDCDGIDSLVQKYLINYKNVTVYYSGDFVRNNHGNWITKHAKPIDRKIHTEKDIIMTKKCDYAIMVWNGNSLGTEDNIQRCKQLRKPYKIIYNDNNEINKVNDDIDLL